MEIYSLNEADMIFVFGSNLAGSHGAGAALDALRHYGAVKKQGFGPMGQCYAIPTKDEFIRTMPLAHIRPYVEKFKLHGREVASSHPEKWFKVTAIGTGLAGLRPKDMAKMFENAPDNCYFDMQWEEYLPDKKSWGTFPSLARMGGR